MASCRRAPLPLLLVLVGCATTPQRPGPATDGNCAALKGAWEGTLAGNSQGTGTPARRDEVTLRLVFAAEQPRVFLVEGGKWIEAKSGKFHARCLGPSAVVEAIDSDKDADGTWVETWVLAVTVRGSEELLARWIRMVNNVDVPLTNRSSKFSSEAVGTLRSVPMPAACRDQKTDGSTTLGQVFERQCDCGNADACEVLALMLEREGNAASLAEAKEARAKACKLGSQQSCAPAR